MVRASLVVCSAALVALAGCAAGSSGGTTGGIPGATVAPPSALGGAGAGSTFGAPGSTGSGTGKPLGNNVGGGTPATGPAPGTVPGPGTSTPPPATTPGATTPPGGTAGGAGTPPAGGTPAGGTTGGTAAPQGNMDPMIPAVSGDCPMWATGTITFGGLAGIQLAVGPKAASPTAPMVFYWHGTGSTSGEFAFMATAVQQGVAAAGGIIVSFQGTTGGDLLSGTAIFGAGDFKLADQLLACAVRDYNIDPRKIYAMGCSAGGLFSSAMAAERSSYIAAAAPNSGGWTVPVPWQNMHTPALMTVHGAPGMDVVGVDFSNTSATADMAFKQRGGFVIDCNTGGGHCGGGGLAGDVWKFFQAHTFGVNPEPWTALPAGFSSQCMIK